MKVTIIFDPVPEAADEQDASGLTEEAFNILHDALTEVADTYEIEGEST